jgi:hypothetical protein
MTGEKLTVERLDRAIKTVADSMLRHNLPQLITTIRRLEAERDRLARQVEEERTALDYAREILRRTGDT